MVITFVKELPCTRAGAKQALYKTDDLRPSYYVVSSTNGVMAPAETLVFLANYRGNVGRKIEVAGYAGASREDALNDLANLLGGTLATDSVNQVGGRKFRE